MKPAWLALALGLSAAAVPAVANATLILEKVVILQRHGVRAPTKSAEELAPYATAPWPRWPVAPGQLTPHGATAIGLLGGYLRHAYAAQGLLPAAGCPAEDSVFVWADSADQRTLGSGDALLAGMFSGCGLSAHHRAAGTVDPLFHASGDGSCRRDATRKKAALPLGDGTAPGAAGPDYDRARGVLRGILAPVNGAPAEASPSVASSLSENLLLEYVEGLPLAEVGWGRVSPATLAAIMPLHDRYADLTRRAPDIAARNGAPLARQILVAIDNGASGAAIDNGASAAVTDAAPIPPAARFVALLGHDTNLSNIGGMLGIDWALPDQPDKTAPDTALAFELWRDPVDGSRYVRVVVHYQTLEQLRQLAALDADHPAPRVAVAIAGCGDPATGLCPLPRFHAMLEDAMPRACF